MRVKIGDNALDVTIGAPGRHIVDNALAVLGAVSLAGGDVSAAAGVLAGAAAQKGRGARHMLGHPDGPFLLIDDSYNANPASMRAALAVLAAAPVGEGGRRIAALGDMLELGRFSAKLHAGLAGAVVAAGVDKLYLAGDEMAALAGALPESLPVKRFADAVSLADALKAEVGPGDAVVVKSSLGLGLGRVVTALLEAFPADAVRALPARAATKGSRC
jgi:UDP-N-acetylmuramoyl-tripeptide--D-alanyl-D-alanine ligase